MSEAPRARARIVPDVPKGPPGRPPKSRVPGTIRDVSGRGTPAILALERAGVTFVVHEHEPAPPTAAERDRRDTGRVRDPW